ncbi:hypothetical protein B194_0546 [Serratia plymuthica A30]|nr:hypothetical protein B194_0546 [Serratia plymuthica A30]
MILITKYSQLRNIGVIIQRINHFLAYFYPQAAFSLYTLG